MNLPPETLAGSRRQTLAMSDFLPPCTEVLLQPLKTRLGSYLRAVRSGATIVVTERGEPVAEIRPLPRGSGGVDVALDRLAALGMLTRGSGEKLDPFDAIQIRRRAASDAIRADREDRF